MTVYVESNFVLELALEQEEHFSATEILRVAIAGDIRLAFPAFSVSEPIETIWRRGIQRDQLSASIRREMTNLARSGPHQSFAGTFQSLGDQLREIKKTEMVALQKTLQLLLKSAEVIPITAAMFDKAVAYEKQHSLTPHDAMVYASVISDIELQPTEDLKCFISRNPKDFGTLSIRNELQGFNCRYISRLSDGLDFIRNTPP